MKLVPLTKNMRLFCRRVVNVGCRRLQPGEELVTTPKGPGALSWRRIVMLYEQRRVISESDPYFEELMQGPGLKNNSEFAKVWLGIEDEVVPETPVAPAVPTVPQAPSVPPPLQNNVATAEGIGGGWYNVLVNGEKINDKSLRKDEADALVASYHGE
jgi:hypothetical protein